MKLLPKNKRLRKISLLIFAVSLLIISFFTAWYFKVQPSINYQQRSLQRYVQAQEKDADRLLRDSILLRKLVLQTETLDEFQSVESKKYGLFLFAETISGQADILFWNTQKMIPPSVDSSTEDGEYFKLLANGWFFIERKTLSLPGMSNTVTAVVLIPVLNQYYLQSEYLETRFVHDDAAINKIRLSQTPTSYPIQTLSGKTLFYIKRVAHTNLLRSDTLTLVLRLSALVLLLLFVHQMAAQIVHRRNMRTGVFFLGITLTVIRAIIYFSPAFFTFRQFELFDPLIYASNNVNRSLGDLLLNAAFLCWIILFAWHYAGPSKHVPKIVSGKMLYAVATVSVLVLILTTFQLANVVRGLVVNSKVSFNVSDFFSLDGYTVVAFIVLALLCFSYYYFSRLLFLFINPVFKGNRQLYMYFFIALVGLIFLSLRNNTGMVLFHLPVLLWLILYTLLLSQEKFIINSFNATIAGVLFWIFVFSASLASIILQGNREVELRTRKGIAEKYDQLTDPSSERTLSIAITYLNNRFLRTNFYRFANETENKKLRDSIVSSNLLGYNNRYDTRIYVFDSFGRPLHNNDVATFAELNTTFNLRSRPTEIPDLYYHETSFDRFTYITKREIRDTSTFLGTFFIVSTPKQYNASDALYPELFSTVNRNGAENSPVYSYAVYVDGLLKNSSAKYPFQTSLLSEQVPTHEFEARDNRGYDELWYKANPRKIVIVARKQNSLLEIITLFSYLFCAFLFLIGFLQAVSILFRAAGKRQGWNFLERMSIRSQVHGTIIFISVFSFFVIGIATISFFIDRYKRNNEDRLGITAGIMVKEMQKPLAGTNDSTGSTLKQLINEVAEIHNVDVNVYDLEGNLELTSDEDVYNKGILSTKMHPLAYYHLDRLREVQRVQDENVSSLNYVSIYTAVRDKKGAVRKYLNIPYFSSQLDLKQEISNFLVTIINLNAFIFLMAGIVALFITNKITQSFSVIGQKMRAITLNKSNEEIAWHRKDEIGDLVKQYNKMVHELERSAQSLAQSEREGAWREMARQVAHEIKNPLTPMKLSIQYLQRAIDSNQGNIKDLTSNVAATLIEQIDHLSKIAADFSQFANIGNKKIDLVDLHQVIGSLVNLYTKNPKVSIGWQRVEGSIILKTDRTQMNRLFTNLLTNAVDSVDGRKAEISIHEMREEGTAIISIKDNGEGIPEEIRTKIFTPNFTTKTSGTGLGLAMCKSIVEQSNGDIWFETEEGKGTIFFVRLPIIS